MQFITDSSFCWCRFDWTDSFGSFWSSYYRLRHKLFKKYAKIDSFVCNAAILYFHKIECLMPQSYVMIKLHPINAVVYYCIKFCHDLLFITLESFLYLKRILWQWYLIDISYTNVWFCWMLFSLLVCSSIMRRICLKQVMTSIMHFIEKGAMRLFSTMYLFFDLFHFFPFISLFCFHSYPLPSCIYLHTCCKLMKYENSFSLYTNYFHNMSWTCNLRGGLSTKQYFRNACCFHVRSVYVEEKTIFCLLCFHVS